MFCVIWDFLDTSSLSRRAKLSKDERPPCDRKLGRLPVGKKPETPPAESALRIAPVCKKPLAVRARGPRNQGKLDLGYCNPE